MQLSWHTRVVDFYASQRFTVWDKIEIALDIDHVTKNGQKN